MTTRLPPHTCPWCSKALDSAAPTDQGDWKPAPGDMTLCFGCGEYCIFNSDLTLRKPDDDEMIEIGLDPVARRARLVWVVKQEMEKAKAERDHDSSDRCRDQ